jgi:hypothetical protein
MLFAPELARTRQRDSSNNLQIFASDRYVSPTEGAHFLNLELRKPHLYRTLLELGLPKSQKTNRC